MFPGASRLNSVYLHLFQQSLHKINSYFSVNSCSCSLQNKVRMRIAERRETIFPAASITSKLCSDILYAAGYSSIDPKSLILSSWIKRNAFLYYSDSPYLFRRSSVPDDLRLNKTFYILKKETHISIQKFEIFLKSSEFGVLCIITCKLQPATCILNLQLPVQVSKYYKRR